MLIGVRTRFRRFRADLISFVKGIDALSRCKASRFTEVQLSVENHQWLDRSSAAWGRTTRGFDMGSISGQGLSCWAVILAAIFSTCVSGAVAQDSTAKSPAAAIKPAASAVDQKPTLPSLA